MRLSGVSVLSDDFSVKKSGSKKFGNIKSQKQPQIMKIDLGLGQSDKKRIGKVKKQNIEIEEPNRKSSSLEFTSLMDMLSKFGKAFYLFSTYNC